jgi:hypothetical protein
MLCTSNLSGVWKAASHCSEIRIHPSGKFLYVGNRGHESLAVFAIDQTTGGISLVQIAPTNGMAEQAQGSGRLERAAISLARLRSQGNARETSTSTSLASTLWRATKTPIRLFP